MTRSDDIANTRGGSVRLFGARVAAFSGCRFVSFTIDAIFHAELLALGAAPFR